MSKRSKRSNQECRSNESLKLKKGTWTSQEDEILKNYVSIHGDRKWSSIAQNAGLSRSGKSCRLRWLNYLKPGIKRGHISSDEEELIIKLHRLLGNRWSLIAGRLPGRTDNEIKNYWNTILAKKNLPQPEISSSPTARLSNIQRPNYSHRSSSLSQEEDEYHDAKEMATTSNNNEFSTVDPTTWDALNFDFLQMDVNNDHDDSYLVGSSSSSCNVDLLRENELVRNSSCGSVTTMGDDQNTIFHNELKKVVSFLELEDESDILS